MKHKHDMLLTKTLFTAVLALALLLGVQTATAGVTAEEAAQLKTTLTPMGAERAGNAEGTIPAWEGGYTKVPEGYQNGNHRPDFFADEKPRYSITGKNMDQYKDKLSVAVQYQLKHYPGFRLDVYPTHRTAAAPQWVYDHTFKNATRAKLSKGRVGVTGAFGGAPFPIPKNGNEVMMNAKLYWRGVAFQDISPTYVVTPDGKVVLSDIAERDQEFPYYKKEGSPETYDHYYWMGIDITTGPPYKAGGQILSHDSSNESVTRGIWRYLVGQRRVRRAPSLGYDTPNFVASGIGTFDEVYMLFGPIDRHDYKLLGKKEMYVIYNSNKTGLTKYKDLLTPRFVNPDHVRWELHRVWMVEAKLKEGKRHSVPRRIYYVDEDTWQILMIDGWDGNGDILRWSYTLPLLCPDVPVVTGTNQWAATNLQTGSYFYIGTNESEFQYKIVPPYRKGFFSPSQLLRRAR